MFGAGGQRLNRTTSGVLSVGAVLSLLTGGAAVIGSGSVVGASTKTAVSSFTANPSALIWKGGKVTLSAKLTDAKTCTFSVTPKINGLPATKSCTKTSVTDIVTIPNNDETRTVTYTFGLSVKGTTTVKAKEVRMTVGTAPPLTGVSRLASDGQGDCAVLASGGIRCWGDNSNGALGNGTIGGPDKSYSFDTPQAVTGITNAVAVASLNSAEYESYCAVLSTGGVECWGNNTLGQLATGSTNGPDGPSGDSYDTPQPVTGITNAISVTSDGEGYCAVLKTRGVACWGTDASGQLGDGTTDVDAYTPQSVVGLSDAVAVVSGPAGYGRTSYCALLSTGRVDCWGDNTLGELGDGAVPNADTAQPVVGITNAVSVTNDGNNSYCAVLSTGVVDCWGDNANGELGNGTTGGPDCIFAGVGTCYDTPTTADLATSVASVSSDGADSFCAVLSSGGMDCWGDDTSGELGHGVITNYLATPQYVAGITNAVSATGGTTYPGYCAVLSTGGVKCWGDNTYGELGNGTTGGPNVSETRSGFSSPQSVASITHGVSVTNDYEGYCAGLSTGGVDCWGNNATGELGNGAIGGPDGQEGYDTPQPVSSS